MAKSLHKARYSMMQIMILKVTTQETFEYCVTSPQMMYQIVPYVGDSLPSNFFSNVTLKSLASRYLKMNREPTK